MKDSKKVLFLLYLFVILSIIDCLTQYRKCIISHPEMICEILLHRLINIFAYFAWIFDNKIILIFYIIFMVALIIHWSTNNWECILTKYENKVCKFNKNARYDYFFIIFDEKTASFITIIIKIVILIIILKKLFL